MTYTLPLATALALIINTLFTTLSLVVLVQSDYDYVQAAQMCILIILIF